MKKDMIDDTSKEKGRRERGFWIYYDSTTKKYYTGKIKLGEYTKGAIGTNASVKPSPSQPSQNGDHIPKTAVPVTFIHRHTSLTNEKDVQREVGPSPADEKFANDNNVDIIVVDYIGTKKPDGKYYIDGGHDINDPMKEYIYTPKKK